MNYTFVELPNQTIYLNVYNIIHIDMAIPMDGYDLVIMDKNGKIDWRTSTWYLRQASGEYHGGIGLETIRKGGNHDCKERRTQEVF